MLTLISRFANLLCFFGLVFPSQTRTNLEGDDQVDLLTHHHEEFGPQVARQADLRVLCVRQQT